MAATKKKTTTATPRKAQASNMSAKAAPAAKATKGKAAAPVKRSGTKKGA